MAVQPDQNDPDGRRLDNRFRFGRNWQRFLLTVDEQSIQEAERRLVEFLEMPSLSGKTFLDIGSGSGLHSLAACRLGADVVSFDFDPDSVAATRRLKNKYDYDNDKWQIETGSVLDRDYLISLGTFDIVYSWGVLHHTGAMWQALKNAQLPVKEGGKLYIAIYNDHGEVSRLWLQRKQRYCALPFFLRPVYFLWVYGPIELEGMNALNSLRRGRIDQMLRKIIKYLKQGNDYKRHRGMSRYHDMVDWLGGYPYEFAKVEDLVAFYHQAGFELVRLSACNDGTGNHELLFVKVSNPWGC